MKKRKDLFDYARGLIACLRRQGDASVCPRKEGSDSRSAISNTIGYRRAGQGMMAAAEDEALQTSVRSMP